MDERTAPDRTPNSADIHIGARVRMRRKALGIRQETLAGKLKLSYQQLWKYESGTNRISASTLYEIGRALQTPMAAFFDGLDEIGQPGGMAEIGQPLVHDLMMSSDGSELITAFSRIRRDRVRKRLVELVRALAAEDAKPG